MARFEKLELNAATGQNEAEAVVSAKKHDHDHWMAEADRDRRIGHYESALRYYSRALELNRTIVPAWVGQVQMLIQLNECPEADLWGRKALELLPGNAELLAGRAQALCRTGDLKQAGELSDGAVAREGASAYRWMIRGELMLCQRQNAAEHCFGKALQIDPDWLVPVEVALVCHYHRAPAQGLKYVQSALEKEPNQPYPWYVAGLCQMDLEMVSAAVRSFQRCISLSPGHSDAHEQLAALSNRSFSLSRFVRGLWRRG